MGNVTRRRFLLGATLVPGAVLTTHARAAATDVIVVGAGAAGLATARTLIDKGKSVVVVEARDRIGGRAYTETETFGVPYDQGCHWLHTSHLNPWIDYAEKNGFEAYPDPGREKIFVEDRLATKDEARALEKARRAIYTAIGSAGSRDISPTSVFDLDKPWHLTATNEVGPQSMGKDLEHFSCIDWWNSEGGTDWFCKQGFGAMVVHYGRDIPVRLSTPVRKITMWGDRVRVETTAGPVDAKAVVVTVSTGVMAAGGIAFEPALPERKREAFERITMGTYNNIALQFSEDVVGFGPDVYLTYEHRSKRATGFLTNISGSNLSFAYVGGSFGRELEKAGVEAAVDFAVAALKRLLGNDIQGKFVKGFVTRWGEDPWTLGSYASAEPGAYHLRKALRDPVDNCIFFAGEACHKSMWATCAGAYLSGVDTAKAVMRVV